MSMDTIDTQLAPSPDALKDDALMNLASSGDQLAFATLVERYRPLVFQQAVHFLGDPNLAEDVTQAVFLQLHLLHPEPKVSLKGWLMRVVYTRSINALKKRHRERRMVLFSELEPFIGNSTTSSGSARELSQIANIRDSQALPDEIAENHDLQQALQRAIEELPPKFRTIVLLRYIDQLSYTEISHLLGIPIATAKSYFKRARPLLRNALIEEL